MFRTKGAGISVVPYWICFEKIHVPDSCYIKMLFQCISCFLGHRQSFSKVLFTLSVNNTGQSSQIQGQISTTALKKALAGKIISGSQKTFAKAVTDVTKIETRDYDTLASVVTSIKLKTSEIAALETEMAASIKASSTCKF